MYCKSEKFGGKFCIKKYFFEKFFTLAKVIFWGKDSGARAAHFGWSELCPLTELLHCIYDTTLLTRAPNSPWKVHENFWWKIGTLLKNWCSPPRWVTSCIFLFQKPFTPKNTGYPTLYFLLFHHHWPFWRRPREKPFWSELVDFPVVKFDPGSEFSRGTVKIAVSKISHPAQKGKFITEHFDDLSTENAFFPQSVRQAFMLNKKINEKHYTGNPQHKNLCLKSVPKQGSKSVTINFEPITKAGEDFAISQRL